jgi:hypothetical protein
MVVTQYFLALLLLVAVAVAVFGAQMVPQLEGQVGLVAEVQTIT